MSEHKFHVEAYAGYKGEETPRSFTVDGTCYAVAEIVGRWDTDTHCYFKVKTTEGHCYVLRFDADKSLWELVMREDDG